MNATKIQPIPKGTGHTILPFIVDFFHLPEDAWIRADLEARTARGIETYGEPLTSENGRDAAIDALQEAEDLLQYAAQIVIENDADRAAGRHPRHDVLPIRKVMRMVEEMLGSEARLPLSR
ncbi:MAG: hypothetical protein KKH12_16220 [Gammaproteobacteria bacterium]|nr:hypothetical protein [Gammaproteobacteria bacterium]